MNFSFHPEADTEFREAVEYYEACEPGLGYDFSLEVFSTAQNIVNSPTAWPIMEEDVRRCLVNRFPYGVLYSIENTEIFILARRILERIPWETFGQFIVRFSREVGCYYYR